VVEAPQPLQPELFQRHTPQMVEDQFAFLLRAAVSLDSK
jgi:hypothetical protein